MNRTAPLSSARLAALALLAAAALATVAPFVHPPVAINAPVFHGDEQA